jgi:hypothetical protein
MIGRDQYHWAIDTKGKGCLVLWASREYKTLNVMPAPYKVSESGSHYTNVTPLDKHLLINLIFTVEKIEVTPKI